MRTSTVGFLLVFLLFWVSSVNANVRLTLNSAASERPAVAIDSVGTNVVVWQDNRDGNYEIYWRRFTELGVPLTGEVRVTNTSDKSARPDVSCDSTGKSYIVWQEGENANGVGTVYFCVLDRNGNRVFSPDIQLGTFSGDARIYTLRNGISAVVWHKFAPTDQKVYYRRLSATGTSLCSQTFDAGTLPGMSKTPCVSVANGTSAVYWRDMDTMFNTQLYEGAVNSSCNKGSGVMYPNSNAQHPDVDGRETSGTISVVFDLSGKIYEFLGGKQACVLSSPTGNATLPRVAYDGTTSFVVWQDARDGNNEIYMCRFVTDCVSEIGDVRLTSDPASSQRPDVAMQRDGSNNWVAVWQDNRDGNWEIYMTGFSISEHGSLAGKVTEPGGSPVLAGAKVTVLDGEVVAGSVTTGADGRFQTGLLQPGTYTIRVAKDCYRTCEESGVVVPKGLPTIKNIELQRGPLITQILPESLFVGDTGVDVLIKGEGLSGVNSISFGNPGVAANFMSSWSDRELHVNLSIGAGLSSQELQVRLGNTCGFLSNQYPIRFHSFADENVAHPRDYAPTFWFAPVEEWFPISPFFMDGNGSTYWVSAPDRKQKYSALLPNEKKARVMVYYYVYGDDEPGVPFPNEGDPECIVYEYWLYFIYDDFIQCKSIIWNQHYHDWEKFFIFVGKSDGKIKGMAGSAHLDFNPNNVYEFNTSPGFPFHPTVLVEWGGHTTCPDMDEDGVFNYLIDVNGCALYNAWGIQDLVTSRGPADKVYGPGVQGGDFNYSLASLTSLRQVVDPEFTVVNQLWDDSREHKCVDCNPLSAPFFLPIKKWFMNYSDTTFVGSPVAQYDPASPMILPFIGFCTPHCWQEGDNMFVLAHAPIEHAWRGSQAKFLTNPRKILPDCYGSGSQSGLSGYLQYIPEPGVCDMAMLFNQITGETGGMKRLQSEESAFPFAYTRARSDRKVVFGNLDDGIYTFQVQPEGAAPYQQTLHASPADTLLGVNGNIYLVPDTSYFTLKVEAETNYGSPLPMAQVRVFAQPDSLLLPTLADSMGLAYASLDTAGTYKVTIKCNEYEDSTVGIRGSLGDTVCVNFVAIGVDEQGVSHDPLRTQLYQNYPNPFNPVTVLMFDVSKQSHVCLTVLDISGRVIATVFEGDCGPGTRRIPWNGKDNSGSQLASGVYLLRLEAGPFVATRKMVLLR